MENMQFTALKEEGISLSGSISNNCLHVNSSVYGKFGDSEKDFYFSEEDTKKIFDEMSVKEFAEHLKTGLSSWLDDYIKEKGLNPRIGCWADF